MNNIYLMVDEKRDFALFKVGYCGALKSRIYAYTTHNPLTECISHIKTQERSKRNVENMYHLEIEKRGYTFVTAKLDHKRTEWFKVEYSDSFYTELLESGLNAFQCGKNRKNYGYYTID